MSKTLRIVHRTQYRYDRPVTFGVHRLMLRPRDGHDLWVQKASLLIEPHAELRWHFDTFGNSIAEAVFSQTADTLTIESDLLVQRYPANLAPLPEGDGGTPFPVVYDADDHFDLAPLIALQNPGDQPVLRGWLDLTFKDRPDESLAFLRALGDAIHHAFEYSRRDELGTQSAAATIGSGGGTCRDFAFLFMEAARSFGFAARFVTGYLHDPQTDDGGLTGGGATHAWAEIYIPGRGWIGFDPTNRIVAAGELIRVATTRTPTQASPITGSFTGDGAVALGMDVSVTVTAAPQDGDSSAQAAA